MSELSFIGRKKGRPPRAGVRASERIEFVCTKGERAKLENVAAKNRQPLATIIREAVNSFVADYGDRVVFVASGDRFKRQR